MTARLGVMFMDFLDFTTEERRVLAILGLFWFQLE